MAPLIFSHPARRPGRGGGMTPPIFPHPAVPQPDTAASLPYGCISYLPAGTVSFLKSSSGCT